MKKHALTYCAGDPIAYGALEDEVHTLNAYPSRWTKVAAPKQTAVGTPRLHIPCKQFSYSTCSMT
jgi:hypothetical protein